MAVRRGALCQEKYEYKGFRVKMRKLLSQIPVFPPSPAGWAPLVALAAIFLGGPIGTQEQCNCCD